ncbi:WhiB family transcriptional regulator [Rhodococcus opacus]|uniref:Transcriptional regulator WhiB n=1 Tax=Rhodococcus opacus (strain B4) TaxID=632772 RepID=C1B519_RHOOB|nr:WhiB family transcriptional regulator [Rhodococcus opacus]BAH50945.1 putative WhiB family regulatory protein [Rhodococcus opacus B4]
MPSLTLTVRLLTPHSDLWDWQTRALCRTTRSDLFFGPDSESRATRIRRERQAQELCQGCPVRHECQRHALEVGEPYGVWGGLTESDRRFGHDRARQHLPANSKPNKRLRISPRHPRPGRQ